MRTPILLSQAVNLGTSTPQALLNEVVFRNPYRTPMLIDALRYEAPTTTAAVNDANNNEPAALQTKVTVANQDITREYVPCILLHRIRNPDRFWRYLDDGYVGADPSCTYTWTFAKPVLVMPNEALNIWVRTAYGAALPNVRVTVVGRSIEFGEVKRTRHFPVVALWTLEDLANLSDEQSSGPAKLANPHRETMTLEYLSGWLTRARNGLTGYAQLLDTVTIRLSDDKGRFFVRDQTPFFHLNDLADLSWNIRGAELPQNGYLEATAEIGELPVAASHIYRLYLAMVGHRSMPV